VAINAVRKFRDAFNAGEERRALAPIQLTL
jgi:hypothetical protein